MRGAAKGEHERTIVLAHQVEWMARQKTLKAPEHYLKPPKRQQRGPGAVAAMLRRMQANQGKEG